MSQRKIAIYLVVGLLLASIFASCVGQGPSPSALPAAPAAITTPVQTIVEPSPPPAPQAAPARPAVTPQPEPVPAGTPAPATPAVTTAPVKTEPPPPPQPQPAPGARTETDDDALDLARFLVAAPASSGTESASDADDATRASLGRKPPAFTPNSALPGEWVTVSGTAKPNSFMSFYFYCSSGCSETHVNVTRLGANTSFQHKFQVPAGAKPGAAYLLGGCDTCGNGWSQFAGLTIKAKPVASPERLALIEQSYRRALGRSPTADETKFWAGIPSGDPRVASLRALVAAHLQYLKENAETDFGTDVAKRAFKYATGEDIIKAPKYDGAVREIKANAPAYSDLVWHIRVDMAWRTVHGRAPTDADLKLWKSMFGVISDEEDAVLKAWNINKVVAALRKNLREKANTPLGREVVTLAFQTARGRAPDNSEVNIWIGEMAKDALIYPDLVIDIGEVSRITFTSFDSITQAISNGKLSESVYIDAVKKGLVPPSVQWTMAQRYGWRHDPPAPALSLVSLTVRNYLSNAGYVIDHLPDFIILGLNQGKLPAYDPTGLSLDNMGRPIRLAPAPQPISYSSPESVSQGISQGRITAQEIADLMKKNSIPQNVLAHVAIKNEVFLANVTPLLPTDIYLTQVTPLIRPDQLNNAAPLWVRLDLIGNTGAALGGNNIIALTVLEPLITTSNPLSLPGGNAFSMLTGNNTNSFSVQSLSSSANARLKRLPAGFFR
ncbi:MAG: hypothetical protein HY671_03920 [Chloroflexi bacterium]|nr:hypothetical protein [Chloroflexota bacterium]